MPQRAPDPGDPRILKGESWEALCQALSRAGERVLGAGVPDSPRDRAEGFRYLSRFLAAGIVQCVTYADADHPVFGRMIDYMMPWGLDCPDCLYLWAPLRGDASYRIHGTRGSANHLDIQVNWGHFANGDISQWGTIASADGFDLAFERDGSFELFLGGERRPGNWLPLEANAEFVLVRQYFSNWDDERPGDLFIDRLGAEGPVAAPRTDQMAERLEKLIRWFEKGALLWENMSRGMLSMEPNTLLIHRPEDADARAGMRGQAYGMGGFRCGPDEAVIVELEPPACHHWSVSLANWYWEAIEYASRQSSLNGHQARLDADGRFRGVISHSDPGVPNWIDTAGHERGTLTARFLRADVAPSPSLRVVPFRDLRDALPTDTPRVDAEQRETQLERRRQAVLRRFRR